MKQEKRSKGIWRVGAWIAAVGLASSVAVNPPAAFSRPRREGASLAIYCGTEVVKGELIGVRADAIVVLSEKLEEAIPLADIDKVKVFKGGMNKAVLIAGSVAGGLGGLAIASSHKSSVDSATSIGEAIDQGFREMFRPVIGIGLGMLAGLLTGAAVDAVVTKNEVILLKGMPQADVDAALMRLRKFARVQNYR